MSKEQHLFEEEDIHVFTVTLINFFIDEINLFKYLVL